jgi:aryl-alcohol dehydrogenase-like predicted oxidoreductase
VGKFRRRDGRKIVLATKFDNSSTFSPNRKRSTPGSIREAVDGSLRRLGLERLDLYQVHFPLKPAALDEYMGVLADMAQAGKIGAVGVSNFNAALMRKAHACLARRGVPLASNQVAYNLLHRYPERNGVLDACRELNVALIAYTPLATGILSGKYRHRATKLTVLQRLFFALGSLDAFKERRDGAPLLRRLLTKPHAVSFTRLEPLFVVMDEIAKTHQRSTAQVAVNWLLTANPCVIPIPGAKNERQARENAGALGWRLTEEERARLSKTEEATW